MESNKPTTPTPKDQTTTEIEEVSKHPLWLKFREVYKDETGVHPEDSIIRTLVPIYWRIFLAGVETQKESK
jgi:hypothetical protein